MDKELLKKIKETNGINPGFHKELFFEVVDSYKAAFEKKFGKPTMVDGLEIYHYKNEYFIYCKPFPSGQYSSSFSFGDDGTSPSSSKYVECEIYGEYGEHSSAHTQVKIPYDMCTQETAKVFPVKKS